GRRAYYSVRVRDFSLARHARRFARARPVRDLSGPWNRHWNRRASTIEHERGAGAAADQGNPVAVYFVRRVFRGAGLWRGWGPAEHFSVRGAGKTQLRRRRL